MKKIIMLGLIVLLLFMLVGCDEYADNLTSEEVIALTQYQMPNPSDLQGISAPWLRGIESRFNSSDLEVMPAPVGITMSISSHTVSGLSFYFENLTEYEFVYGESFTIYTLINNAWERVEPTIDGYWAFIRIGYTIFPNSSTDIRTVDWTWLFGELPSGDYRFQKDIRYVRQPGDFDKFTLESFFTLP